ncbi:MAG: ferredoxin reductase family protein [Rhodospirillales bacterium]
MPMLFRNFGLYLVYLAVVLLPVILSWTGVRQQRGLLDESATAAGMLAFAILLVEFLLSGRFRTISGGVGMDVTMRWHQVLARAALLLAVLHPFLYQAPFIPAYPWDDTRQLSLSRDSAALASGIAGWLLLIVLTVTAIGRNSLPYRYETWRLMHGIGALLLAALLLHHTLGAGRYSDDPVIAGVWIAYTGIAMASLLHVYLVKPLLHLRRPWQVSSVQPVALRTWELSLRPTGHAGVPYRAGEFAWIKVGRSAFSLAEKPFSIASAPGEGQDLRFLIKELGDFTGSLDRITPGTSAFVDGPHGNLTVAGRDEPGIALIAGGIGIAPMLGILRQLRLESDHRPTALVYGNRIAEQIVFPDELEAIGRDLGTEITHCLQEPADGWTGRQGMLDTDLIRELFDRPDRHGWLYVICGPGEMMDSVEAALKNLGIPRKQILLERFQYD